MTTYRCSCGNKIGVLVRLSEPPTCTGRYVDGNGEVRHAHSRRVMKPDATIPTNTHTEGTTTMASTKTTKTTAKAEPKAKAPKQPDKVCGCNAEPVEDQPGVYQSCDRLTGGRFAPGHDAKLKGVLIRCAVEGVPYKVLDKGKVTSLDPIVEAERQGWTKHIQHGIEVAAAKAAKRAAKADAKAQVEKATAPKPKRQRPSDLMTEEAPAKQPSTPKTGASTKTPKAPRQRAGRAATTKEVTPA